MSLTLATSRSCGLVPRCGGWGEPSTRQPSRRKFFLMVSGVTKISLGFGWKWCAAERKNPKPFSEISKYPEPISGAEALLIFVLGPNGLTPKTTENNQFMNSERENPRQPILSDSNLW